MESLISISSSTFLGVFAFMLGNKELHNHCSGGCLLVSAGRNKMVLSINGVGLQYRHEHFAISLATSIELRGDVWAEKLGGNR